MPIFISYSHQDKTFVDNLAAHLVKNKARVWIDRWELHVGDSIIEKVQDAIQESDALIIVISKASMQSEWCKKELSSGLLRELEEKKVLVLPALTEQCDMPVFLRGKMYADFTNDFKEGLKDILEAVASITSDTQGRIEDRPGYHIDWSMDWGFTNNGSYFLNFTFVDHSNNIPYVVLTNVSILADDNATARYRKHTKAGKEWLTRYSIIGLLGEFAEKSKDLNLILDDSFPKKYEFSFGDPNLDVYYHVFISCRRMGQDTGRDVLMDFGNHFVMVKEQLKKCIKDFPSDFCDKI